MEMKMKKKILIVDDEEMNRELLRNIFADTYEIEMAYDGKEAITKVNKYKNDIAVILLDLMMPVMNGYQVLQALYADTTVQNIPVVLVSSNTDLRITLSCYTLGAADVISKPFINEIVRRRVENIIKIYQKGEALEMKLQQSEGKLLEKDKKLESFYDKFLEALGNVIEYRDLETGSHINRVRGLTQILATTYKSLYPKEGMTQEKVALCTKFSAIHDIGKIAIPDSILLKPGKLTADEFEIIKSHTTKGCDILQKMETMTEKDNYRMAYNIIRHHHERYDGEGYPDGLAGDEIPIEAQIVGLTDAYDVLVNERVYKKAYSTRKAYEMIVSGECGKFSPKILHCFEYARKVMELFSDTH